MSTNIGHLDQPGIRARSYFAHAGPGLHAALRIGAALLFMQHGVQKLFGLFGGMGGTGETASLLSLMGVAGVMELVGGLLLLAGALTRPVALLLAVEMAVAYVKAHMPQGGLPVENQGELALLYMFIFAFFVGNGAGPWSVDQWLARRRSHRGAVTMPHSARGVESATRPRRERDTAA